MRERIRLEESDILNADATAWQEVVEVVSYHF